jgi:NAD(P)H-hydrate epimerase
MCHGVADVSELSPLLEVANVIAFGPGLGQSDWAMALFEHLSGDMRPAVWDADALNLLAQQRGTAVNRIITPHPGEAARLLATTIDEVQSDRQAALAALAKQYGGTPVLKGAGSLISSDTGIPWLCTAGNPGMAAPGMGDVLTGIIAALLAQGLAMPQAAATGVELHARAGDLAARGGERGLIASDVIECLRSVVNL